MSGCRVHVVLSMVLTAVATAQSPPGGLPEYTDKRPTQKLQKAADAGDPRAQTVLAWRYANGVDVKYDIKRALKLWQAAADKGDSRATLRLGFAYVDGEGVDPNVPTGQKQIHRAADQHMPLAMARSGMIKWDQGENELGLARLDQAAASQSLIAQIHQYHRAQRRDDHERTHQWAKRLDARLAKILRAGGRPKGLASLGPDAPEIDDLHSMALMLMNNRTIPGLARRDTSRLLEMAASHGDLQSVLLLAEWHKRRFDDEPDIVASIHWYKIAKNRGYDVPRADYDPQSVLDQLLPAAEAGDVITMIRIANLYYTHLADAAQAAEWLVRSEQAAPPDAGIDDLDALITDADLHVNTLFVMAILYHSEIHDAAKAAEWLIRGMRAKYPDAAKPGLFAAKMAGDHYTRSVQSQVFKRITDELPEVEVNTTFGRDLPHTFIIDQDEYGFDAVRFRAPRGASRHMAWGFRVTPHERFQWYITPIEGAVTPGFKDFYETEGVYEIVQFLDADSLKPGREYALWFSIRDHPGEPVFLSLAVNLLLTDEVENTVQSLRQALGMPPLD